MKTYRLISGCWLRPSIILSLHVREGGFQQLVNIWGGRDTVCLGTVVLSLVWVQSRQEQRPCAGNGTEKKNKTVGSAVMGSTEGCQSPDTNPDWLREDFTSSPTSKALSEPVCCVPWSWFCCRVSCLSASRPRRKAWSLDGVPLSPSLQFPSWINTESEQLLSTRRFPEQRSKERSKDRWRQITMSHTYLLAHTFSSLN